MLDDFKTGVKSSDASNPIGTGGETFTMASNNPLWIYTFREDYNNVPQRRTIANLFGFKFNNKDLTCGVF